MTRIQMDVTLGRSVRRLLVAMALILAFAAGATTRAAVRKHDTRLDDADAALVKAIALLQASEPGTTVPKVVSEFDKHVGRAITDISNARDEITAAAQWADSGR